MLPPSNLRALEEFRDEMKQRVHDPYTVLMKAKKLPMGLLSDPYKRATANLLTTESFDSTFGKVCAPSRSIS